MTSIVWRKPKPAVYVTRIDGVVLVVRKVGKARRREAHTRRKQRKCPSSVEYRRGGKFKGAQVSYLPPSWYGFIGRKRVTAAYTFRKVAVVLLERAGSA